jgi:predicted transcriptional regulator
MRRSKLQIYFDVLEAVVFYGPLRITRITYKANLSYNLLKPILRDMMEKELVEERKLKKGLVAYAATNTARETLLRVKEFAQVLPIV